MSHSGRSVGLSLMGNSLAGVAGTAAALYPINGTPAVVGFLRLSIGAATLLILSPFFGGKLRKLPRLMLRPGVWVMAITSASYQALFFASVQLAGVAAAALVTVGCIPVAAGLVGWLVLKERPTAMWLFATTLAVSGLAIRSAGELHTSNGSGLLLAVCAGTGIGGYLTAAKIEIRHGGHPMQLPGMAYFLGSLCLLPIIHTSLLQVEWTPQTIWLCVFLGVITMGLANAFQILGLHGISPGVAATMMLADPVTATVLGLVVMHETLTSMGAVGLALVVLGLLLQSFTSSAPKVPRGRHRLAA